MTKKADKYPGKDYLAPRNWPTWIGIGLLWLLSRFPFKTQMALGRGIGKLSAKLLRSRRQVAIRNLELAFPELTPEERLKTTLRVFEHVGMGIAEAASMWFRPVSFLDPHFTIEGLEHLEAAKSRGKGVIILQAHFTLIEAAAAVIGSRVPMSAVVDNPKNELFGALLKYHRERHVTETIENHNIRKMIRRLRNNEVVWYSPDLYVAKSNGGILTNYFQQPVLTTDGIARIARMTGATLIPYYPNRQLEHKPARLVFLPPLTSFDTSDLTVATQQMNDLFEAQVRRQPDQYFWVHKRFKSPDKNFPDPYKERSRQSETANAQ